MAEPQSTNNDKNADEPAGAEAQTETKSTSDQTNSQDAPAAKKVSLCGICEKEPSKYKCPRCYLPYCSVACNKIHRENHPPDPEPAPKPIVEAGPTTGPPAMPLREDSQDPNGLSNRHPFRSLQYSEQLQWLFKKYPRLPTLLCEIQAATEPPPTERSRIPASLLKDLPPQKDDWNRDKGIEMGKEALRKVRKERGEDGEAIREYSELVLYFMEEARGKVGR